MAGDPIITAIVMTIPKTIPTIIKRLFNIKNYSVPDKKQMNPINNLEEPFNGKIAILVCD
jgi:hypothetical protein